MTPHTDAGALLKLAEKQVEEAACRIWHILCPGMVMGEADMPHYETAAKEVLDLYVAAHRQAASQGSAGVSQVEVRSEEVARVAEAIRLRSCERGYPVHPNVAHHLAAAALEAMHASAQAVADCGVIEFEYCNWEGRKAIRQARPISIRFGKSEWHPKPQWLLLAFDLDKGAEREFAMADMAFEDDALAALMFALIRPGLVEGAGSTPAPDRKDQGLVEEGSSTLPLAATSSVPSASRGTEA